MYLYTSISLELLTIVCCSLTLASGYSHSTLFTFVCSEVSCLCSTLALTTSWLFTSSAPIHNELSFEMFLAMFVLLTTSGGTMHGIILYCSVCQMGVRQWTRGRTYIYMEEYERMNDINVHDGPGRLDMCAWGGGVRNCVWICLPYSTWALIEFICSFFHSNPKKQIM